MKKFKVIEAFLDVPTGVTYSVGDTYETADKERIDLLTGNNDYRRAFIKEIKASKKKKDVKENGSDTES
ncbi:hypothetical protein [Enterococcus cecorum]|uniref:hypothetical protein n=1 Tax=Enterococcus cecorum TaxID=44008 RepID=UPI00148BDA23|nr:hypothetical protein [Enterococcus cecorum]